ncbi:MAG: ABC transporter substrate-binding protein [Bdellovibrionales bacterium]|nr:ABC transporter substrate-binding protein [Bdellovibrionales bacterium]
MVTLTQHPSQEKLFLTKVPQRIVSLVPSVTETMIEMGLMPIGRSSFCIEPHAIVEKIPRMGGTKTPNIKRIVEADPDLVIANQEENRKEDIEELQKRGLTVWVTYPSSVSDTSQLLSEMAQLAGNSKQSQSIVSTYQDYLRASFPFKAIKTLILIWKDPYMAVGSDTYTDDLLSFSGGVNVCKEPRYPTFSVSQVQDLRPDLLILPTEPYAFGEHDIQAWRQALPQAKVISFCGEDLFWSGLRAIKASQDLSKIFLENFGNVPYNRLD